MELSVNLLITLFFINYSLHRLIIVKAGGMVRNGQFVTNLKEMIL